MDQLEIFERLQTIIDTYERGINEHYDQLEMQTLLLLDKYYSKYGESINEYTKYHRLQSLQRELDQTATAQYQQIAQDMQQAGEETSMMTYLLYAYLIYLFLGEDDGKLPSVTSAVAKTSVAVAVVLLLLKAAKTPWLFFDALQIDVAATVKKHKDDYVYGVFNDIKQNLRTEAGYTAASKQVKKRSQTARGYGVRWLSELANDAINYTQQKVYEVAGEQMNLKKMWVSMRDTKVRQAHRSLDSKFADKQGYFHYGGDKAKYPKGFKNMELNYGCRCKTLLLLDGNLPRTSEIYDYRDIKYNRQLNERIRALQQADKTYIQALQQAQKDVKPPKRKVKGYVSWEEWNKLYGKEEG